MGGPNLPRTLAASFQSSGAHGGKEGCEGEAVIDLILFNSRTAFAPSVLGSGVAVGGFEVACEQVASGVASGGRQVLAYHAGLSGIERGVTYVPTENAIKYGSEIRALLTARACPIPPWIRAERTFTTCVDDPRGEPESFAHLKGRTTIVCLSEWQANLYRELGHERVIVIPSMIADDVYSYRACEKVPGRFVCVNAWNKGTDETLRAWARLRKRLPGCELHVGSPYSHPPDAAERCAWAGAKWIGQLGPSAVVSALSTAEAVFRVCTAPETFGVADAIAEVVGARVHCLCTNGFGGARDALSSQSLTVHPDMFEKYMVMTHEKWPTLLPEPRADYRVSTIIKRWEEVLFG